MENVTETPETDKQRFEVERLSRFRFSRYVNDVPWQCRICKYSKIVSVEYKTKVKVLVEKNLNSEKAQWSGEPFS